LQGARRATFLDFFDSLAFFQKIARVQSLDEYVANGLRQEVFLPSVVLEQRHLRIARFAFEVVTSEVG